jgi:ketosteroid isomerase-like protein
MSRENMEIMEGLMAGVAGMDKQAMIAALPELIAQTCDPEIEWVEDPSRPDHGVYRGHDAVRESWTRWLELWDKYGLEAERFVDCGDDVLIVAREHARGLASGATVGARNYAVVTLRDGKIIRYREFYDEQRALEAVGLTE